MFCVDEINKNIKFKMNISALDKPVNDKANFEETQNMIYSDWQIAVLVSVVVACFILIVAFIAFALKHQLCGHCVQWADTTSELSKSCTTFFKKRYHRLTAEENKTSSNTSENLPSAVSIPTSQTVDVTAEHQVVVVV